MQHACSRLATPVLRIVHTGLGPYRVQKRARSVSPRLFSSRTKLYPDRSERLSLGPLNGVPGTRHIPCPVMDMLRPIWHRGRGLGPVKSLHRFTSCQPLDLHLFLQPIRLAHWSIQHGSIRHFTLPSWCALHCGSTPYRSPCRVDKETCSSRATPLVAYGTAAASVCWSRYLGQYPARSRSGCGRCSRS